MNIRIYLFVLIFSTCCGQFSLQGQSIEILFQKADSLSRRFYTHLSDSVYLDILKEQEAVENPAIQFRALLGLCKNRLDYFQFPPFYQYLQRAESLLEQPQSLAQADIGYFYLLKGTSFQYQGQLEKVPFYTANAEEILETIPEEWPRLVELYLFISQSQLRRNDRKKQKTYIDKAFAILLSKDADLELLGDANLQLARFYRQQNSWEAYLKHAQQAEADYTAHFGELHPKVAIAIQYQSHYYDQRGDLNRMLQKLEKTQTILDQLYPEHVARVGQNAGLLSNCYRRLGRYELAHQYIDLSIDRLTNHMQTDQVPVISDMYRRKALIFEAQDSMPSAIQYFEKSLEGLRNVPENVRDHSQNYQGLTRCYLAMNQLEEARTYNQLDFDLLNTKFGPDYSFLAETYRLSGNILINAGQLREGIAQLQLGLEKSAPSFKALRWTDLPKATEFKFIPPVLPNLKTKAMALRQLATQENQPALLKNALETYRLAIELIDLLRSTYQAEEAREIVQEDAADIYQAAAEVMVGLSTLEPQKNWKDSLYTLINKGKAMLLKEAMLDRDARQFAGIPDSVLEKEQELRTAIGSLRYDKQGQESPITTQQRQRELIFLEEELDRYIEQIKVGYPKYYELKYDETELLPEILREEIAANQAIVQYFFAEEHLVVMLAQSSGVELISLPVPDKLEQTVGQFLRSLRDIDFIRQEKIKADSILAQSSTALYKSILEPLVDRLSPKIAEIVIVPDGILTYLPFEQLCETLPTSGAPYQNWPWLVKKYSISYSYATKMWWRNAKNRLSPKNRLQIAAFAPTYAANGTEDGLVDLPYASQEVSQILKFFGGDSWVGEQATEKGFKKIAGTYDIYHLAMHGLINDQEPMRSYLAFQQEDLMLTDEFNDNFLSVAELYALNLDARMVVLSACNTGVGQLHQSEGLISLARAFSYGGASSIVMTMWSVSDRSTAQLMTFFYKNLKKGKSKDEALRQAKLSYLEKVDDPLFSHPYFWGGFMVVGEVQPVFERTAWKWGWMPILVLIGWFFYRFFEAKMK